MIGNAKDGKRVREETEAWAGTMVGEKGFDGEFDGVGSVEREFGAPGCLDDASVIYAGYRYVCYEGIAYVLFERGGQLFSVEGGHCSCYGLEGQWIPAPDHPDAVRARRFYGDSRFRSRVHHALARWEAARGASIDAAPAGA